MTIREAIEADIRRRLFQPISNRMMEARRRHILWRLLERRMDVQSGRMTRSARARSVVRVTPEIIECNCLECGGDGDWGKFLFDGPNAEAYAEAFDIELPYVKGTMPCIDCKGTGRIYA